MLENVPYVRPLEFEKYSSLKNIPAGSDFPYIGSISKFPYLSSRFLQVKISDNSKTIGLLENILDTVGYGNDIIKLYLN